MDNWPNNKTLLWMMLGGGIVFTGMAILGVAGLLIVTRPAPPTDIAEQATAIVTQPAPLPTDSLVLPTATPMPPTNTPIPALDGDVLSLPSATSTLAPTPTARPTATVTLTSAPVQSSAPVAGVGIGNIAPDFTLGSQLANRVSLSDLRGKIVILNFWATWCAPCRNEVPALQAVHNEYGPQGVVVLAVNMGEKLENVERFAHDNGVSFNVWLDEDGWAGNVYGVRAIPTTFFIDEEGIVRTVHFGSMSREQIVRYLEALL